MRLVLKKYYLLGKSKNGNISGLLGVSGNTIKKKSICFERVRLGF